MRKLVTVRTISKIEPIPDADKIECAHVDGWTIVVSKGEFFEGQNVFYFEIDSMLPIDNSLFSFLESRGVTIQNGIKYHRLRTMRLRGQLSQGLLIPYSTLNKLIPNELKRLEKEKEYQEDKKGDFSELFKVVKYEAPIPMCLQGEVTEFPSWISTTDEERIQNFPEETLSLIKQSKLNWIPTEKIDGTSATFYCKLNYQNNQEPILEYGACSKNYEITENENNTYWKVFKEPRIEYQGKTISILHYLQLKCLEEYSNRNNQINNKNISLNQDTISTTREENLKKAAENNNLSSISYILQGELFGESIQNNRYKCKGQAIKFFNFFRNEKQYPLAQVLNELPELEPHWVPILEEIDLDKAFEDLVRSPDGIRSHINPEVKQIEGIVWRHADQIYLSGNQKASFKTISNKYLLKYE